MQKLQTVTETICQIISNNKYIQEHHDPLAEVCAQKKITLIIEYT